MNQESQVIFGSADVHGANGGPLHSTTCSGDSRGARGVANTKNRRLFFLTPSLRSLLLITVILTAMFGVVLNVSAAVEYRINGTVTTLWFDKQGNSTLKSSCEFVWFREGEKWRVDVLEPDSSFPSGVWHSVLPFMEGGLISIRSYPPVPDRTNSMGSAYVEILTNRVPDAQNINGEHAVWLALNADQILSSLAPSDECPAFWSFDPELRNLSFKSHRVLRTNGSILFFNRGSLHARSQKGKLIFENGQPKMTVNPVPFDAGYKETELKFSSDKLNDQYQIPRRAELLYFGVFADGSQQQGLGYWIGVKRVVDCNTVMFDPIPDTVFSPVWTNSVATVVDYRERSVQGAPLAYVTSSRNPGSNAVEVQKRKALAELMKSVAVNKQRPSPLLPRITICIVAMLPLALWWRTRTKKTKKLNDPKI